MEFRKLIVSKLLNMDWRKWYQNTMVFLAPLALIYLTFVGANLSDKGFQPSDFDINPVIAGAMYLYLVNVLIDFFRKFKKA